jgi:integrase
LSKILETKIAPNELSDDALPYIHASTSEATKKAYQSDWLSFKTWATGNRVVSYLPATGPTVANYITFLAKNKDLAAATISRALSSISQAHETLKLDNPVKSPEVSRVNKGIRRKRGTKQKRAKPLVLKELMNLCDEIPPTFLGRRDQAILLVGWAAALRRSEIVALDIADIDFVGQGMTIEIARSKTDQEGEGYKIGIPYAKNKRHCPVENLKLWINLAKIKKGPLFFAVGTPGKKWHTHVEDHRRLSAAMISTIIKRRLIQAGKISAGYSGHSLRAGFITSAAAKSMPESLIQKHTRHDSLRILRIYMRDGDLFESNPLSLLL